MSRFFKNDRLAVGLLAMAVVLLFIHGPGLGDDFQYWWIAADLHLKGASAWNPTDFHSLRWPLWGLSWILQGIFGPGMISYYGIPMFYVTCGALMAYALGARLFENRIAAWGCALAYLFHPLLDDVIYRPMPDLSEGVFIAAAAVCWLAMAERNRASERLPWALATGAICFLLYANRLTGIFVFGVLFTMSAVLAWKNQRFSYSQAILWLGVAGLTWLALVSLEGLVYHHLTGDFFHSLTSNLGARGRKGTESVSLLAMPFRFFGSLWINGVLGPIFTILAFVGGWRMWRTGERQQRAIVAWAVTLYLAYNCAIQSLFPLRPLLRNADRFLCSLAIPMGVLGWAGVRWLWNFWPACSTWTRLRPIAAASLFFTILAIVCSRDFFDLGYLPDLRATVRNTPPGTRVFTHDTMRFAAMLADADAASRLQWSTEKRIFSKQPATEQMAAEADEFWYCRKHLWLSARKQLERDDEADTSNMAPYLDNPHPIWILRRVVLHDNAPEFVFYKKRPANAPKPERLSLGSLCPQAPAFPILWHPGQTRELRYRVNLPDRLKGKPLRLEIEGKSNIVEAIDLDLHFLHGKKRLQTLELTPYLQHKRGIDFHTLEVPTDADACEALILLNPKTKSLEIDQVWLITEP
jgi:hypothetical protein